MDHLGVFYRRCLCTLLGVSTYNTHNGVLYVLSGRGPLQIHLAKALFRLVLHTDEHPGLLGSVAAWVCGLDSERLWSGLFLGAVQDFASWYSGKPAIYHEVCASIQTGFARSSRLSGRGLLSMWT